MSGVEITEEDRRAARLADRPPHDSGHEWATPPLTADEELAVDEAAREELDAQADDAAVEQAVGRKPRDYYLEVETATDVWERHVGLSRDEARELRPWLREQVKAGKLTTWTLERAVPELYAIGPDEVKAAIVMDLYPSEGPDLEDQALDAENRHPQGSR